MCTPIHRFWFLVRKYVESLVSQPEQNLYPGKPVLTLCSASVNKNLEVTQGHVVLSAAYHFVAKIIDLVTVEMGLVIHRPIYTVMSQPHAIMLLSTVSRLYSFHEHIHTHIPFSLHTVLLP